MPGKNQIPSCSFLPMNSSKSHRGYQRLGHDHSQDHVLPPSDPKSTSIPNDEKMTAVELSQKVGAGKNRALEAMDPNLKRSIKVAKSHPLLSFFDMCRKKKPASVKPELIRYLEYVKEGGTWDLQSNRPVIHFK